MLSRINSENMPLTIVFKILQMAIGLCHRTKPTNSILHTHMIQIRNMIMILIVAMRTIMTKHLQITKPKYREIKF